MVSRGEIEAYAESQTQREESKRLGVARPPQAYTPEQAPIQPAPPPIKEAVAVLPSDVGRLMGTGAHVYMVPTMEYERYKGISTVPSVTVIKAPSPGTSEWFVSGIEWALGGGLEEAIWTKLGLTEEQKAKLRPVTKGYRGETLYEKYGVRVGPKAIEEFAYVPVGAFQVAESFWRPTTPTLVGAGVSYVLTGGKAEVFGPELEKIEAHPGLLLGEMVGEYFLGKAFAWGAGKAWKGIKYVTPQRIKIIYYRTTLPIKVTYQARVRLPISRLIGKTKLAITKHLPSWRGSRLEVWLSKRGPVSAIEKQIVWGEEKFLLPGGFELSESMSELYKHTGFPVLYGKKATYHVIQVTPASPWVQIQKGIERGLFPKMGTLAAQQVVLTKKMVPIGFTAKMALERIALTASMKTVGVRTVYGVSASILTRALTVPKRRAKVKAPTIVLPKPKILEKPFELERQKFGQLEWAVPKKKEREKVLPLPRLAQFTELQSSQIARTAQMTKQFQKQVQRQKQIQIPSFPPELRQLHEAFKPPTWLPGLEGGRGRRRRGLMYGAWFYKEHPIEDPEKFAKKLVWGKKA